MTDTLNAALNELRAQRARIEAAIRALDSPEPMRHARPRPTTPAHRPHARHWTAEQRAAASARMKARHAARQSGQLSIEEAKALRDRLREMRQRRHAA